jgi:hypothetical protein
MQPIFTKYCRKYFIVTKATLRTVMSEYFNYFHSFCSVTGSSISYLLNVSFLRPHNPYILQAYVFYFLFLHSGLVSNVPLVAPLLSILMIWPSQFSLLILTNTFRQICSLFSFYNSKFQPLFRSAVTSATTEVLLKILLSN